MGIRTTKSQRLGIITSQKHPGDIFIKVRNTKDNFICKFYAGHQMTAQLFIDWIDSLSDKEWNLITQDRSICYDHKGA